MIKKNMLKEYLRYILPTMLTFTLASVYSIVDGMFVGHAVGDAGVDGIWFSVTIVQMMLACAAGALLRYRHRRRAAQAAPAPQPVGEGC